MEKKKVGRPKLLDSNGKPLYPDQATKLRIWRKKKKEEYKAKQLELMKERLKPYTIQPSEREQQLANISKIIIEENKNKNIEDKVPETIFSYLNRMIKNGYNIRYSREQGTIPNTGIVNQLEVTVNDITMKFDMDQVKADYVKKAVEEILFNEAKKET